ncbi:restriction endonuclease subunit S [Dorea longicatena]|uniref:restriction endonuclease subunit S n=1 Tax=Dorea longicatena TaxID=88431 RepID=UPI003F8BB388
MGKPTIRFEGYTDDWEQRKVSEIVTEKLSNGIMNNQVSNETGLRHINVINMYDTDKIHPEKLTFSGHDEEVVKKCNVEKGDIFLTRSSLKPEGIAEANVLLDSGRFVYDDHLIRLKVDKEKYDSFFVKLNLSGSDFKRQFLVRAKTTAFTTIGQEDIIECSGFFPVKEEQKKIGFYFDQLDHLITLHQRKCEETKKLKKFMLQKMFPQKGEKVPKIRFDGFTDDWEQRKFGDLVEKYEDPVKTPTEGYMRLGIRSHAKGTFHSYVEKGKELETAKMFRVAADKFIVNITFGWEHAVAITDEDDAGKLVSHRFPQYSFNNGILPKFFRYLILDEKFKHHLELSSPGGAGRNRVLKLSDMLEYKMNFPCEEEQRKIAVYFDDLDHLITLHQRKCEELQNIKKFMLQNMFV